MKRIENDRTGAWIASVIGCLLLALSGASGAEWEDVTVEEAEALLGECCAVRVLDVRTEGEFAKGHLEGALRLEYGAEGFEAALADLSREQAWLVHCASGVRSEKAVELMKKLGFERVYHLPAGMKGWAGSGRPVVKP